MAFMTRQYVVETLNGLDRIQEKLVTFAGTTDETAPQEQREDALAAGFAHGAIADARKQLIDAVGGDPR